MADKEKKEGEKIEASRPEAHVSKYKKKIIEKFTKLIKEYPIVGAVNMEGMPAPQLQIMRGQLRDKVILLMNKRRLLKIAIEQCKNEKKGIENLEKELKGMPALLFTKENPFKLYKMLEKSKSPAPAKPGQIAPHDIVVPAGPTPFAPGPIIGELGAIRIKTEVKEGKVAVKENTVVVKEGEEIKANVAGILTRLGITPMEIGLDLVAVYEDGIIYGKKVLAIDEVKFAQDVDNAARWAFNLAVEIGHYTKETINVLVPRAFRESKAVSVEAGILNDSTRDELLAKAERQANALKSVLPEVTAEALKEAPKEEAKQEPVKNEEKAAEKSKAEPEEPEKIEEKSTKEVIEEKEEEIKEEVKEIKKDIEKAKKENAPDAEEVKEIEEKVEKVEDEIEEVEEMKKEEGIKEAPKVEVVEAEPEPKVEIIEEKPKPVEKKEERVVSAKKKKQAEESEKLFQELKKKGTLRGVEKEKPKVQEPLTPEDIIRRGQEEMKKKAKKE